MLSADEGALAPMSVFANATRAAAASFSALEEAAIGDDKELESASPLDVMVLETDAENRASLFWLSFNASFCNAANRLLLSSSRAKLAAIAASNSISSSSLRARSNSDSYKDTCNALSN